jgi:DNA-binding transcriptional ArsR family regulator
MIMKKTDLILHPVRLQILSTLSGEQLSTKEVSDRLYNIPSSTIYRHMKVLLENDLIKIVDTRSVKGTLENVYTISQPAHLDEKDMENISKEQHFQYFLQYILSLMDGFQRYLNQPGGIDMGKDFVGYSETYFYVNQEEMMEFGKNFQKAVKPFATNRSGNNRRLHKFAMITHPILEDNNHDNN